MTSREQFEAWFKYDYHPDKTGPYIKDIMFVAWQASREAVEVQLPELFEDDRHAVTEAIRAAGIKVKGE